MNQKVNYCCKYSLIEMKMTWLHLSWTLPHRIRGCIQKFPDWVDNEMTTINTRWDATQRIMEAKLTRLTHKIAIQLHLVAESCTICSSRSRRPVRKLLYTPSYVRKLSTGGSKLFQNHNRKGYNHRFISWIKSHQFIEINSTEMSLRRFLFVAPWQRIKGTIGDVEEAAVFFFSRS
jgi:hypothetical protein